MVIKDFFPTETLNTKNRFYMIPSQILFVNYADDEDATRFISQNLDALYAKFKAKGYTFISLADEVSKFSHISADIAMDIIRYCYPYIKRSDRSFHLPSPSELVSITDRYIKDICKSTDYKEVAIPGLLRLVEYSESLDDYIFEYKRFNNSDKQLWMEAIDKYIRELPELSDDGDFSQQQHLRRLRADYLYKRVEIPYGRDVFNRTYALMKEDKNLGLYEGFIHWVNKQFNPQLEAAEPEISRIQIGNYPDYRIMLSAYDDLEIQMTTLPKALYILFLLHPEGIRIKDLPDYYPRLREVYKNISKRENMDDMDASIRRLCNPLDDSVRQNMSRIRKAFINVVSDRYASLYYISGKRGEVRYIPLVDRHEYTVNFPPEISRITNIPLTRYASQ
jgi:hypothetical protein